MAPSCAMCGATDANVGASVNPERRARRFSVESRLAELEDATKVRRRDRHDTEPRLTHEQHVGEGRVRLDLREGDRTRELFDWSDVDRRPRVVRRCNVLHRRIGVCLADDAGDADDLAPRAGVIKAVSY